MCLIQIKLTKMMLTKKFIYIFFLFLIISCNCLGQKVITNGSVVLSADTTSVNTPGSIRWTGTDFEGWTGNQWLSLTVSNTVRDKDGNIYHPIKIGSQVWLEENLKTTQYNDGTPIPLKEVTTDWASSNGSNLPAYCWFNNDIANKNPFGALYNFYSLDTVYNGGKNVCPSGYHVPSNNEWNILINFLGGTTLAGGPLKERGTSHWITPNTGATNDSGFTGLPGGRRGPSGTFAGSGSTGYYRSSTADIYPECYYVQLNSNNTNASNTIWNNGIGMSVRCIRD